MLLDNLKTTSKMRQSKPLNFSRDFRVYYEII